MKRTEKAFLHSIISLVLCVSMLMGTTFAWFTDTVTNGQNVINAGTLKADVLHFAKDDAKADDEGWVSLKKNKEHKLFDYSNWEPGYIQYETIKIANEGNLAFQYRFLARLENEIASVNGDRLADVIDVYVAKGMHAPELRTEVVGDTTGTWQLVDTLSNVLMKVDGMASGAILPASEVGKGAAEPAGEELYTIALHMQETAENEYQNLDLGDFYLELYATQYTYEEDSFGKDYDAGAFFPEINYPISIAADITGIVENGVLTETVIISGPYGVRVTIPEGVRVEDGATKLTLSLVEKEESESNVTLGENEQLKAFDVHVEGIAEDNTVPMTIEMGEVLPVGLNKGNLKVYHVEDGNSEIMEEVPQIGDFTKHNQFTYDPITGATALFMATFSEVTVVADTENAWNGEFDYSWYENAVALATEGNTVDYVIANADQLAAFGAIVGGMNDQARDSFADKTVKLISDVNLGDKEAKNNEKLIFYPIGYYNSTKSYEKESGGSVSSSVSPFKGTFDGNGHTISNFYQNTWEMFGDYNDGYSGTPNHYKDAMGLFGYVYGGTVKNLTVNNFSSDGEFTPTGVIAAYAAGNAKFENIAITNCNPRVYNTGNGGIIGIAGDTSDANDDHITLKNITVDNSNKITALWGSWDVACGGLVGMYRGNVDGSGNATGDTISFENCHVSAQIDVYNDVCANYQYYAYRYAGMIIGSVRHNTKNAEGKIIPDMTGISAKDCTVNYGDWNDYYYCEFEKNTMASYSEDYQFSRIPHSELKFTDSNGNGVVDADERASVTGCKHAHTVEENHQAVYLPFHQLFTGYSWGVSSIGLEKYSGIVTNLGITEGDQQESVIKFESAGKLDFPSEISICIGELFKTAGNALEIKSDNVQVTVSPIGEESTVSAIYDPNTKDWTKGSIKFNGVGSATVTITDYYFCIPTTITVNIDEPENIFEIVFDHDSKEGKQNYVNDYIYRVGNKNPVALESLFTVAEGIDIGDVSVTINPIEYGGAGGTVSELDRSIQFNGTGIVKVSISHKKIDNKSVELYLEVIDATNVKSYSELKNTNSVLLNDIEISNNGAFYLSDATLYGNGFTFNCVNGAYKGSGSVSENYVIALNNAHLDNVEIIGKVYTTYGGLASADYNRALVVSKGNCSITNCYLSNTASPIRLVEGTLDVKGTTVKGGNFANIDVRNGHLTVEDVTTINQANGNDKSGETTVIGLGIVIYYENVDKALTSVNIKGRLTQYNHISSSDKFSHEYATTFVSAMMGTDNDQFQTTVDGTKWANSGIVSMVDGVALIDKREGTREYSKKDVTLMGQKGYVYTVKPSEESINTQPPEYKTLGQGFIAPTYSFDYTFKNYIPKTENSNDYCYYENGKVLISMDQGDKFGWDPFILTTTKNGETLDYIVVVGETRYEKGNKIVFEEPGDYIIEYTYIDNNNYTIKEGKIASNSVTYTKTVNISVSVIQQTTKHAEFTFADTNTETEKITVNNKTYISAKDVSATDKEWGYITVNGTKIFYPITEAQMKMNLANTEVQVYYYVFKDAVTIRDYKDGGTGEEQIYNASTTTMPSKLTVVNGMEAKYTGINSACVDISRLTKDGPSGEVWDFSASSVVSGTEKYKGYLAHRSPSGLSVKSGTRDYDAITVAQFSYTDEAGATYYYFVGYYMPNQYSDDSGGSSCVTPDTLITLSNGEQKRIDELSKEDKLLVWDFTKGKYTVVPSAIIVNHGYDNWTIIELQFEDGTIVKAVNAHAFFDETLNEFVLINEQNAKEYLGHHFVKADGESYTTVRLVDCKVYEEYTESYTLVSAKHYNFITENMFSLTNALYPLTNGLVVGENMKYDQEVLKEDIEKYGKYKYSDFKDYVSYKQFLAFNGSYLKISVEKGYCTFQDIINLINEYLK